MLKKLRDTFEKKFSANQPAEQSKEELILNSNLQSDSLLEELDQESDDEKDDAAAPRRLMPTLPLDPNQPRILRLGPEYPTLAEQQTFIDEMFDFNALYTLKKNDLFSICHNFTMLIKLMQEECEKDTEQQRFIHLCEDETTGRDNKRYDFELKVNEHFFPAYLYRYQKKIVYGLMPEAIETAVLYHQTIPALIALARLDIEILTQRIQKTAPPFEVISSFKDEALTAFLRQQFHLS
jgi:hypothetical protein